VLAFLDTAGTSYYGLCIEIFICIQLIRIRVFLGTLQNSDHGIETMLRFSIASPFYKHRSILYFWNVRSERTEKIKIKS